MAEPHAHSQPIQTYGPAPHKRKIWPSPTPTANQYKHMAEPQAHSQPIETYGLAPHNRNIWPSPTTTANQYKHMAQRRIIETYGLAPRLADSFVCFSSPLLPTTSVCLSASVLVSRLSKASLSRNRTKKPLCVN